MPALLVSYPKKIFAKTNAKNFFPMFSSKCCMVSGSVFKSLIDFDLISIHSDVRNKFHSSTCGCPFFPTPFSEEGILHPLSVLGTLDEGQPC